MWVSEILDNCVLVRCQGLGPGIGVLCRFAGGKVLRLDWQFGGERLFEALTGQAGVSGLAEFLWADRVWRS